MVLSACEKCKYSQICHRFIAGECKHLITLNEPVHDKTYKMSCAPSEDSDQPGYMSSLINLRCPHEEILGP